jgi:hypothetical protein
MTLDEKIAQATRHIETGRAVNERQRSIVARYPFAINLLHSF